jgi:hypothetical protein
MAKLAPSFSWSNALLGNLSTPLFLDGLTLVMEID